MPELKQPINQNVVMFVVIIGALGLAEYYSLWILFGISAFFIPFVGYSAIKCLNAYTKNYCSHKQNKTETPIQRGQL